MPVAGDPYSAAFGAAASVAGAALKDTGVQSQQTQNDFGFDNSGWVLNIGSGSASNSQSKGALGGLGQLLQNPMALLAIGVGVLLFMKAKK
jgi:hypothetical protein